MGEKRTKVTVIGSNSYIARNLIKQLDQNKFKVKCYDYQEESLDGDKAYTQVNIIRKDEIEKIDVDCDLIFLFSGKVGTSIGFEKYEEFINLNEIGMINVLDWMVKRKSEARIIFPSTRLVYKGKKDIALKETSEKEFKTIYAMNKFACESYLNMYKKMFGIAYSIFRICIPYGNTIKNANYYGMIEFFLNKAKNKEDITVYGDGMQKRSFIHITDLCQLLIKGALEKRCEGEVFNLGGPDTLTVMEVAKGIAKLYGVKVKAIEWPKQALQLESWDTIFDSSKIEGLINYSYQYTYSKWLQEDKKAYEKS